MPKRLLIVDDEVGISALIERVAEPLGYSVSVANDSMYFMRLYEAIAPDVVMVDIFMPGYDGIEIMRQLVQAKCTARVLFMSGADDFFLQSVLRLAADMGLQDIGMMTKPIRIDDLRAYLMADPLPTVASLAHLPAA
ncbi:MAG: response regulator [Proteobacteria bacterium]|nr:response regulator [Pseudomonadota bacterium]